MTSVFALVRGLRHRWRGRLLGYQKDLACVMTGATLSVGLARGVDAAQVSLIWWLILAVVGSMIVTLTTRASAGATEA